LTRRGGLVYDGSPMIRKAGLILLAGWLAAAAGCRLFNDKAYFSNESSWPVAVWPNGQNWESFALNPGDKHEVVIEYGLVSFYFAPEEDVYAELKNGGKDVIFHDRTGTRIRSGK
jgi:hypothetical protein